MLDDILRQPEVLATMLGRGAEIDAFARRALTPPQGGRLYAFGSGDGWFAARAALYGADAAAVSGLDFLLNVVPRLGACDRTLAISMSGNVDRTVEAAQGALARGAGVAVLTNGPGGRLGALGGPRFSLDLPDIAPFLCGTASYVATAAVLRLATGRDRDAIAAILPGLPAFIGTADTMCRTICAEAGQRAPGVRILGVGQSIATAEYGAAKLVEVTTVPAWSDDIEEFAHRQYWSMHRRELVVLLPVDAASATYADATAEALSHLGTPTIALEPDDAPVPHARYRLAIPGGTSVAFIGQAVALQLLAYRLGLANGTDPNRRHHLKDDNERFMVSRRLTRRSLLGTGQ
jgi:fructoselysine-6-P-deglycase FrlB-like protein